MSKLALAEAVLQLPRVERAKLAELLLRSLTQPEAEEAAVENQIAAAFQGPFEELDDARWAALLRGEFRFPPGQSYGAPPGWQSPRQTRRAG